LRDFSQDFGAIKMVILAAIGVAAILFAIYMTGYFHGYDNGSQEIEKIWLKKG
jgi:hypothetical protein